jgi:hypothetical protein
LACANIFAKSTTLADFGTGHTFASAPIVADSAAFQAPEALDDHYTDADVSALGVTVYPFLVFATFYEGISDILQRIQVPSDWAVKSRICCVVWYR